MAPLGLRLSLLVAGALLAPASLRADGFSLARSLANEKHIVLNLSAEQAAMVGRERKLILSADQQKQLSWRWRRVPRILGVESIGEPDCSCCISSAMWTATGQVTIWTDRLRVDKDGSKWWHEVRLKPGYYTANAMGEIFAGGKPIPWSQFEKAVLERKEGEFLHLSLPPSPPEAFRERLARLRTRGRISSKL